MAKSDDTWVWNRYWHFDRLASCFDTDGSNYPAEFKDEWGRFFEKLPQEADILDLCTGNGAVARMAAEFSGASGKDFKIKAVDFAAIEPEKFAGITPGQENIEFISNTPAENLPFEDSVFDAVISQYGFEYTDHEKTLAELGRILKQSARGKFLCHSKDAVQTINALAEIKLLEEVLNKFKLFETAKEATAAVWKAEKEEENRETAQQSLSSFQNAINQTLKLARANPGVASLTHSIGILKHTFEVRGLFPLTTLLEKINEAHLEAKAHQGRLTQLYEAAFSQAEATSLEDKFSAAGFRTISSKPFLLANNKVAGLLIEFE